MVSEYSVFMFCDCSSGTARNRCTRVAVLRWHRVLGVMVTVWALLFASIVASQLMECGCRVFWGYLGTPGGLCAGVAHLLCCAVQGQAGGGRNGWDFACAGGGGGGVFTPAWL